MRNSCPLICTCLLITAVCGGCSMNLFRHMAYVLTPAPIITVKAEYDGLDNQTVAILIYADQEILYVRNHADAQVAAFVAKAFEEARGRGKLSGMKLVPVAKTAKYQERTDWYNMEIVDVGRKFGAGRVVYIELEDYSRKEIGSPNLLRGRISAAVKVYEVTEKGSPHPPKNPVYAARINQIWPEDSPVSATDHSLIWVEQGTLARFAKKVAKKFYTHIQDPPKR